MRPPPQPDMGSAPPPPCGTPLAEVGRVRGGVRVEALQPRRVRESPKPQPAVVCSTLLRAARAAAAMGGAEEMGLPPLHPLPCAWGN